MATERFKAQFNYVLIWLEFVAIDARLRFSLRLGPRGADLGTVLSAVFPCFQSDASTLNSGGELFFRLSNERSQMIDAKSDAEPEIVKLVIGRLLRHDSRVPSRTVCECAFLRQRRGRALVHSGAAPHGATALARGRRANLILWCVRVHALPRWGQAPDDVRRAVVDFSHWRDMLSLAATSKAERRLVLPFWKVDRVRQALVSRYVAAAKLGLGMSVNAVVNNAAAAVAMGVHAAVSAHGSDQTVEASSSSAKSAVTRHSAG